MEPQSVHEHFSDPRAVQHYAKAAASLGLWVSEERVFQSIFPKEATLLEVGCGAGRISIGLWELGYRHLLGIDFVREMVSEARRLNKKLEYGVSFRHGDATRLDLEDSLFDGAIFGFNGLMQIPGRENRRRAMSEIHRVLRPGGVFVFTTHDRANPRYREFWEAEKRRWENGTMNPGLCEFGDRFYEAPIGCTFMHIPSQAEITLDLEATGWTGIESVHRSEVANEPADVREFSDECRFWIARRPDQADTPG